MKNALRIACLVLWILFTIVTFISAVAICFNEITGARYVIAPLLLSLLFGFIYKLMRIDME